MADIGEPRHKLTVKLPGTGELRTVQGYTYQEFMAEYEALAEGIGMELALLSLVHGAGNAAPLVAPQQQQAAPPQQQNPWPQQQAPQQPPFPSSPPPPQQQAQGGHVCACGLPMRLRNGQYGSFYSCSKPMKDPSRCNKTVNV